MISMQTTGWECVICGLACCRDDALKCSGCGYWVCFECHTGSVCETCQDGDE